MADLQVFAEEGFDPKAWANQACKQRVGDEPVEKLLAEVEMRLQLAAEEIEAGLQDISSQAMRRIPFAVQEIYRLQVRAPGMPVDVFKEQMCVEWHWACPPAPPPRPHATPL